MTEEIFSYVSAEANSYIEFFEKLSKFFSSKFILRAKSFF